MKARSADVLLPGIAIGAGLGGCLDGIVLHQILQWHNMLSGWLPPRAGTAGSTRRSGR